MKAEDQDKEISTSGDILNAVGILFLAASPLIIGGLCYLSIMNFEVLPLFCWGFAFCVGLTFIGKRILRSITLRGRILEPKLPIPLLNPQAIYMLGDDGEIIEVAEDEKRKRGVDSRLE